MYFFIINDVAMVNMKFNKYVAEIKVDICNVLSPNQGQPNNSPKMTFTDQITKCSYSQPNKVPFFHFLTIQ